MNFVSGFYGMAAAGAERLVYSMIAGTLLAAAVWFLLQLFPKKDSRTSFAVWFSTLVATAVLPLFGLYTAANVVVNASHSVFTVSASWARYIFLVWAAIASAGLARVAYATFQVRKLRKQASPLDMQTLPPELQALIAEFQRLRPVSVLVSGRLEVPTAIGFGKPAIILPAWLLESTPAEELKYIVLHELAHLRRRDDWTNLAQKLVKALLFFLPSIWWIERRLLLDREMACDDAVLAHSGTPLGYAECLARVAERSFMRRQLALAQAAVGRMRQLTTRVAVILDPNRPQHTRFWKPAVPVVMVVAGLCALPASLTPALVSFADDAASPQILSAQSHRPIDAALPHSPVNAKVEGSRVHVVQAALRTDSGNPSFYAAKAEKNIHSSRNNAAHPRPLLTRTTLARKKTGQPMMVTANYKAPEPKQYVTVREDLYFVVTERTPSGEQQSWQMHVVQVSVQPQVKPVLKPRKV
ncbi:MAG TPA: M56 family metallopeptidase [Candidatus Angelobacter sp.]|jgi:beta-lactamase regulating signal transducer with metallopeptidase domain